MPLSTYRFIECGLRSNLIYSSVMQRDANREMTALLARWQGEMNFDAVVAFSSSMATYALNVQARRRVLDLCGGRLLAAGEFDGA